MPQARRSQQKSEGASPEHRRDIAIASAAQAFALLCEAATEVLELFNDEFQKEMEEKRK